MLRDQEPLTRENATKNRPTILQWKRGGKKKKDGKREREEREGAFGHGKAAPLVFLQHIDSLALRRGPLAVLHAKDDFV
jgi:hypothetical protein